jgi:hypothetical protein
MQESDKDKLFEKQTLLILIFILFQLEMCEQF